MEDQRVGTIINMRSNQGVHGVWCETSAEAIMLCRWSPPAEACELDNAREDSCLDGS